MTATERAELAAVLERATAATRILRQSEGVPAEVEDFVDGLDGMLHAEAPLRVAVDPYLSTTLYAAALRAVKALRHDSAAEQRRDLRVALEQVRQALRDILEGAPFAADVPAREVLEQLARSMNVPQGELAALLGVSVRQLQRWLGPQAAGPSGDDEARVRVVAQIVHHLRHVFTAPGVLAWFRRPHPHLGGAPIELLHDPAAYPQVRELAAASRASAG